MLYSANSNHSYVDRTDLYVDISDNFHSDLRTFGLKVESFSSANSTIMTSAISFG